MPVSDVEQAIVFDVVAHFLKLWEPTPRKKLINQYEDPDAIDRLLRWNLLKSLNNVSYLPAALSFHYCGKPETEALARRSIETMARVFKKLYREDSPDLSLDNLEKEVGYIYDQPDAKMILRLGLYLAPDFYLLQSWGGGTPQERDIKPTGISESVVKLKKLDTIWDDFVSQHNPWPVQDSAGGIVRPQGSHFGLNNTGGTFEHHPYEENAALANSKSIFLVHGHDEAVKHSVARFLERLGLNVVILHEKPSKSQTIIEKFEENSDVSFAVVLLTPDDLGATASSRKKPHKRARQNVVFELGYFIGKLGRSRVCALYASDVELPSDFDGVIYVPYDKAGGWKTKVATEIKAAGISIDMNQAI